MWSGQRDTHHTQSVSQSPQRFDAVLHSNKLSTKDGGLNGRLAFRKPYNQSHITMDQEYSAGVSGPFVSCMFTVYHHTNVQLVTERWRHIGRDSLGHSIMKGGPVKFTEVFPIGLG